MSKSIPTNIDREVDDLIMRMKDCISHENNHDQPFTDRCITKMQFKQQLKALVDELIISALETVNVPERKHSEKRESIQSTSFNDGWNQATRAMKYNIEQTLANLNNRKG